MPDREQLIVLCKEWLLKADNDLRMQLTSSSSENQVNFAIFLCRCACFSEKPRLARF